MALGRTAKGLLVASVSEVDMLYAKMLVVSIGIGLSLLAFLYPPWLWKIDDGAAIDVTYAYRYSSPQYPNKKVHTNVGVIFDPQTIVEVGLISGITWLSWYVIDLIERRRVRCLRSA